MVVTARYVMVATSYSSLPGGYSSLLVVTSRYRSLLLVPNFSMIDLKVVISEKRPW